MENKDGFSIAIDKNILYLHKVCTTMIIEVGGCKFLRQTKILYMYKVIVHKHHIYFFGLKKFTGYQFVYENRVRSIHKQNLTKK